MPQPIEIKFEQEQITQTQNFLETKKFLLKNIAESEDLSSEEKKYFRRNIELADERTLSVLKAEYEFQTKEGYKLRNEFEKLLNEFAHEIQGYNSTEIIQGAKAYFREKKCPEKKIEINKTREYLTEEQKWNQSIKNLPYKKLLLNECEKRKLVKNRKEVRDHLGEIYQKMAIPHQDAFTKYELNKWLEKIHHAKNAEEFTSNIAEFNTACKFARNLIEKEHDSQEDLSQRSREQDEKTDKIEQVTCEPPPFNQSRSEQDPNQLSAPPDFEAESLARELSEKTKNSLTNQSRTSRNIKNIQDVFDALKQDETRTGKQKLSDRIKNQRTSSAEETSQYRQLNLKLQAKNHFLDLKRGRIVKPHKIHLKTFVGRTEREDNLHNQLEEDRPDEQRDYLMPIKLTNYYGQEVSLAQAKEDYADSLEKFLAKEVASNVDETSASAPIPHQPTSNQKQNIIKIASHKAVQMLKQDISDQITA